MSKIKALIINLLSDSQRREYMKTLFSASKQIEIKIIEAVDGRAMNGEEINSVFDVYNANKRYGRFLSSGEIGCTLSHFKCYQNLIESSDNYMLILEDDVTPLYPIDNVSVFTQYIDNDEPVIILLSGDYWYTTKKYVTKDFSIAEVYDAVGSYAYLINKSAAKIIISKNIKPDCTADNWSLYKRQGIKIKAIMPYLIDANIESFESTIKQTYFGEIRKNMSFINRLNSIKTSVIKIPEDAI